MGIELQGASGLLNDLTAMAAAVDADGDAPAINNALKVGAEIIYDRMRKNASSDPKIITGELIGSIKTGNIKRRGTGKRITVGVHHDDNAAHFSNPLEFGHSGPAPAPAHPFVRPAFDTESDAAYEAMKGSLRAAITRSTLGGT